MWVNMGGAEDQTEIPFPLSPSPLLYTSAISATRPFLESHVQSRPTFGHWSASQSRLILCFSAALFLLFLSRLFSAILLPALLSLIFGMNYEMGSSADGDRGSGSGGSNRVLDIYPLSCYYFGSKDPILLKDETLSDRILRMKSNYARYGLRTSVVAVILVELFKHPHLLLLQVKNSIFKLPGGRLRPGESEIDGLKRKLSRNLSVNEDVDGSDWEVGECLGMWWRSDFETLLYPYLPPNVKKPKECTKLFLVRLPPSRKFIVPKNLKLLAIPLCQLHENDKTYGPIIAGVPQLVSKFSFNIRLLK